MRRDSDDDCLKGIERVRHMGASVSGHEVLWLLENLESRIVEESKLRVLVARIRKDAEDELTTGPGMVFDGFRDGYMRYAKDILDAITEVEIIESDVAR